MNEATTLPNIAQAMRQRCLEQAESYPDLGFWCAQHALERGLILTLELRDDTWTLSLSRAGIVPSEAEINICRQAFRIHPEIGVAISHGLCESNKRTTKIVRLVWIQTPYEQKELFDK